MKYVAETKPTYLYFGCAEAQVAANEILGMRSGEVFVHRNLGNQVLPTDVNALAVLEYAVDTLDVKDILVTGHYDCSAVRAAMADYNLTGSVEYWFRPIRDVFRLHQEELWVNSTGISYLNRNSDTGSPTRRFAATDSRSST